MRHAHALQFTREVALWADRSIKCINLTNSCRFALSFTEPQCARRYHGNTEILFKQKWQRAPSLRLH
jgi:hypothetical protein